MPQEKTYTCFRCKKEKTKEQGSFKLGKVVFCCKDCCKDGEEKEGEAPNVCKFC